jgi:hypothetical protein
VPKLGTGAEGPAEDGPFLFLGFILQYLTTYSSLMSGGSSLPNRGIVSLLATQSPIIKQGKPKGLLYLTFVDFNALFV